MQEVADTFIGWPDCDICKGEVTPDDGVLWIDIRVAMANMAAEERALEDNELHSLKRDFEAHFERFRLMQWQWSHISCAPDVLRYEIEGAQVDTTAGVLATTVHLLEKSWLPGTDWAAAVRRFHRLPAVAY